MKYIPSRLKRGEHQLAETYRHVMWLRLNHAPAKQYWDWVCKQVRERDEWTCQQCGKRGWVVHHTSYKHLHFEHAYLNELVTLCDHCHRKIHGKLKWWEKL